MTSRERLALQAEHLHELTGLAYPALQLSAQKTEPTHVLTEYAALQLFLHRVRQIQSRFVPNDADVTAMVQMFPQTERHAAGTGIGSSTYNSPIVQIAARLHTSSFADHR